MDHSLERAVGYGLLMAFEGKGQVPSPVVDAIRQGRISGITLFRDLNCDSPEQLAKLTTDLQRIAQEAGQLPLLLAADQEGGQLNAVAGATLFPGNMALGATGSVDLARRAGRAMGRELAAVGVNVDYAPVCDVNIHPKNPETGIRSFGEDAGSVALLAAAMVEGLQSAGVGATAKHFPGNGNTESDSHHGMPMASADEAHARNVELPPFRAAIQAGARLVMVGHAAFPSLQRGMRIPATLSPDVMRRWLRDELGFQGVAVTDAMNMKAIRQGAGFLEECVKAVGAGADLVLLTSDVDPTSVLTGVLQAAQSGSISTTDRMESARRVLELRAWLGSMPRAPMEEIGCAEHRALAKEIADRSITLVRDEARLLPLRLSIEKRVAAVMPKPKDLTPADTSSHIAATLGDALRARHGHVSEFVVGHAPSPAEIAGLCEEIRKYNLAIVGTINAYTQPAQVDLVNAILETRVPTIVVALRHPADLAAFPQVKTYLCSYGILPPSLEALSAALWGAADIRGRLPVSIPELYPVGFGMERPRVSD